MKMTSDPVDYDLSGKEPQKTAGSKRAPAMPGLGARTFLLADDSADNAKLIQRAFREAGVASALNVVPDGDQAMDYLRGVGTYSDRLEHPMPNVVLLDRDLPRKDGFGVLGWIRNQSTLKSLVVIILTGANRSADADMAYDLGANFYLTRPGRYEELVSLTRCLDEWLKVDVARTSTAGAVTSA
jgi:DNA-binding response OmpR family regulator